MRPGRTKAISLGWLESADPTCATSLEESEGRPWMSRLSSRLRRTSRLKSSRELRGLRNMSTRPTSVTAETLGKAAGADNLCTSNYANCKVSDSAKKTRRAPRVGLLGGRYVRHSTVDRFWARVQKNPDGCWLLSGSKWSPGGHICLAREDGSRVAAHRFSYELHHGQIPVGLVVMHSCDVPRCVNPAHLSAGTQRENMQDAQRKGRLGKHSSVSHTPTLPARRDPRHHTEVESAS